MDIKSEKALLIRELEQVEDISLLRAIKAILHYGLKNEGKISIEQYNQELDQADAEIDSGEFISHEDFKKQITKWR
jgi:hypothetical protein